MEENSDGRSEPAHLLVGTEAAANTGLALGGVSQTGGWPRVCREEGVAGRAWKDSRLAVLHPASVCSFPYIYTP